MYPTVRQILTDSLSICFLCELGMFFQQLHETQLLKATWPRPFISKERFLKYLSGSLREIALQQQLVRISILEQSQQEHPTTSCSYKYQMISRQILPASAILRFCGIASTLLAGCPLPIVLFYCFWEVSLILSAY